MIPSADFSVHRKKFLKQKKSTKYYRAHSSRYNYDLTTENRSAQAQHKRRKFRREIKQEIKNNKEETILPIKDCTYWF